MACWVQAGDTQRNSCYSMRPVGSTNQRCNTRFQSCLVRSNYTQSPLSNDPNLFLISRVQLFLPFRIQFHFYMDVSHFIELFLNRADYFHPSLLNAIYMAACSIAGGHLADFVEYFRECTRVHIQESLTNADRMTHALWAAIILGVHATRNYRIAEAYAIVSSAATFAVACGLDFVTPRDDLDMSSTGTGTNYASGLLPPPTSKAEVLERSRLAYAIFMCDRCLAVRGYPSVFTTSNWMHPTMHRSEAPGLIFTDRPPDAKVSTSICVPAVSSVRWYCSLTDSNMFPFVLSS